MAAFLKEKIRNIALIGHPGEGKTSLMEAILYLTKATDRLGKVDEGNTVSDFDPEEINRRASINLSLANTTYKDFKFNIIDVPGFFDFEGELIAALSVVDAAIIVSGASGVLTPGAEIAIDYCIDNKIPSFIFINGINKENSNYFTTLEAIKAHYGLKIAPIEIPIMDGTKLLGYYDILESEAFDTKKSKMNVPMDIKAKGDEFYNELVEIAAEADDELLEKFFSGETLTPSEVKKGTKIRMASGDLIPVVGGVAAINVELLDLLDKIIDIFPSPSDFEGVAYTEKGKDGILKCDENGKCVIRIFKTVVDSFVGKMLLFKVISGKLNSGDTFLNTAVDKTEKINNISIVKGKKLDSVDVLYAGDMGVLTKLNYTSTNETLCDENCEIVLKPIAFPMPNISLAVSAEDKNQEEKVIQGLMKLQDEDITFKVEKNVETNQVLISGLGETQLEIACKKLKNKFKVVAKLADPKVAYRETIKKLAEAEGKHKKQSGGAGQFGVVNIKFEPGAEDGVFEFVDAVVGGAVPRQFIPAVEKGLREAVKTGVLAGYPMINVKATLFDGKYHPVDSKEIAFITAAKLSDQEACSKAGACFLEPIVEIKIIIPDSYLGDIMGDMNKRRGRILGTDSLNGKQVITAEVPHSEIFKYATDLRAMTQGRGRFTTTFLRYEEVPSSAAQKIIDEYKKSLAEK